MAVGGHIYVNGLLAGNPIPDAPPGHSRYGRPPMEGAPRSSRSDRETPLYLARRLTAGVRPAFRRPELLRLRRDGGRWARARWRHRRRGPGRSPPIRHSCVSLTLGGAWLNRRGALVANSIVPSYIPETAPVRDRRCGGYREGLAGMASARRRRTVAVSDEGIGRALFAGCAAQLKAARRIPGSLPAWPWCHGRALFMNRAPIGRVR